MSTQSNTNVILCSEKRSRRVGISSIPILNNRDSTVSGHCEFNKQHLLHCIKNSTGVVDTLTSNTFYTVSITTPSLWTHFMKQREIDMLSKLSYRISYQRFPQSCTTPVLSIYMNLFCMTIGYRQLCNVVLLPYKTDFL